MWKSKKRQAKAFLAFFILGGLIFLIPVEHRLARHEDSFFPYISYEFNFSRPKKIRVMYEIHVIEYNGEALEKMESLEDLVEGRGQPWYSNRSYRIIHGMGTASDFDMEAEIKRYREIIRSSVLKLREGESVRYAVLKREVSPKDYLLHGHIEKQTVLRVFTEGDVFTEGERL